LPAGISTSNFFINHNMNLRVFTVSIIAFVFINLSSSGQSAVTTPVWGNWTSWGDQGDGTFLNPVLPGDYSDIDCIRVGDDYYAVSSTFQYSPGFVILHSKDLVNWSILGHVVNDISVISPEMNWDRMNRYGRGIWAGAIRYHQNRYWVYFGDPDEGYFMSSSVKPEGPWEPVHKVWAEKGWDDCSPFWDDDGQGYLIGTNFSDGYKIHLFKMSADGKSLLKESDKVIHQSKGSEANKLYKINGFYYHLFSEVRAGGRALMMERSKEITGPYETPRQLSEVQLQFHEPNQGGLIQTAKGDWYFLTHHGTGDDWSGRVVSLLPVHWIAGWPIIGKPNAAGIGEMVWAAKKPVKSNRIVCPQTNDGFEAQVLQPQWEWNYQPRQEKWSLTERKGWLRLYAFRPLADNLLKAGNTLTQRTYRTTHNEAIVKIDISRMTSGQKAGLSHLGAPSYSAIGVQCEGTVKRLMFMNKEMVITGSEITTDNIWLKSAWGLDGKSQYSYSTDGITFTPFGDTYQLRWGAYRGDRLALFTYNTKDDTGSVDVDYFHYAYTK